jgi:hypothetical protein|tara:strand:+ start:201 stop:524 length:324 start_codon:yes stop_codon:yes gene_type:complete
MNLTSKQQQIFDKIKSVDADWGEKDFIKCWNDILDLNKFVSVSEGKLVLEFDDASSVLIKFVQDNKVLLQERIYWNEKIPVTLEEKNNEVKQAAQSIKMLADSIINS